MMIKDYTELHLTLRNKCWKRMLYRDIKQSNYKMINFDDYANENKTEHNSNWPYIPDHPYRMSIV